MDENEMLVQRLARNLKPGKSKLDDPFVKKVILGLLLCFLPYPLITQIILFWDAPLTHGVMLNKGVQLLGVIGYMLFLGSYLYKFYMKKSKGH